MPARFRTVPVQTAWHQKLELSAPHCTVVLIMRLLIVLLLTLPAVDAVEVPSSGEEESDCVKAAKESRETVFAGVQEV